jgi:hypothetical protein
VLLEDRGPRFVWRRSQWLDGEEEEVVPTQQATRTKRTSGRVVVTYRDAKGKTKVGIVRAVSPRPISPNLHAPAGSTSGGTLAAGTYYYRVSATVGGVEGLACAEQSGVVASGTTGSVSLTVDAVTGATAYNYYGRTQAGELLLKSQAGTTYVDTNADTPAGALPTLANALATVDPNYSGYTAGGVANVPQAVAMRGAPVRYFLRYGSPAGYTAPARS